MATIAKAGTANGLIQYVGQFTLYIPVDKVTHIRPANTHRVSIGTGGWTTELDFDDETQRDAAIVTLLSWY